MIDDDKAHGVSREQRVDQLQSEVDPVSWTGLMLT